jgi:8-oxo-dGTP diphosphatase
VLDDVDQQLRQQAAHDGIEKIVVAALLQDAAGRILLLCRRHDDFMGGIEELPSGSVEPGETMLDALTRETAEETGLTLTGDPTYLSCFDYRSSSGKATRQHTFAAAAHGTLTLSEEHTGHRWLHRADLTAADITPQTRATLQLTRADHPSPFPAPGRCPSDHLGPNRPM